MAAELVAHDSQGKKFAVGHKVAFWYQPWSGSKITMHVGEVRKICMHKVLIAVKRNGFEERHYKFHHHTVIL